MLFGGVRVYLGFVWGKFQTFRVLKGLLSFRIGLGCIDIVHIGVYLGLRSKKAENSREAEKWRSEEAKKQRRQAKKSRKSKSREAEEWRSREAKKLRRREKQKSKKAKIQRSKEAGKQN